MKEISEILHDYLKKIENMEWTIIENANGEYVFACEKTSIKHLANIAKVGSIYRLDIVSTQIPSNSMLIRTFELIYEYDEIKNKIIQNDDYED